MDKWHNFLVKDKLISNQRQNLMCNTMLAVGIIKNSDKIISWMSYHDPTINNKKINMGRHSLDMGNK